MFLSLKVEGTGSARVPAEYHPERMIRMECTGCVYCGLHVAATNYELIVVFRIQKNVEPSMRDLEAEVTC